MRIVIRGAGGFLGAYLVRAADPRSSASQTHVLGRGSFDGLERGDTLFDLAFERAADEKQIESDARLLVRGAAAAGARCIVHASSVAVYGRATGVVSESSPVAPVTMYGTMKAHAEAALRGEAERSGADVRIARIANAYGPGQKRLLIYDLIRRALVEPPPLLVASSGDEIRDFVHARDVAEALLAIAGGGERGGVFNVGSGRGTPVGEVARLIAQLGGHGGAIAFDDSRAGDEISFRPSTEKISRLGYRATVDLEDGVRETFDWVRTA